MARPFTLSEFKYRLLFNHLDWRFLIPSDSSSADSSSFSASSLSSLPFPFSFPFLLMDYTNLATSFANYPFWHYIWMLQVPHIIKKQNANNIFTADNLLLNRASSEPTDDTLELKSLKISAQDIFHLSSQLCTKAQNLNWRSSEIATEHKTAVIISQLYSNRFIKCPFWMCKSIDKSCKFFIQWHRT